MLEAIAVLSCGGPVEARGLVIDPRGIDCSLVKVGRVPILDSHGNRRGKRDGIGATAAGQSLPVAQDGGRSFQVPTVGRELGREPINLPGGRLRRVRYASIATKFRSAAK
jgi:hypothetical protein